MSPESPFAPPKASVFTPTPGEIQGHKKFVVQQGNMEWPSRCYKCNAETDIKKKVKITYVNPLIYLTIFITFIITIVLALVFQKKFTIQLPVCETHLKKRKNFILLQWGLLALMVLVGVAGVVFNLPYLFAAAALLVLVLIITAVCSRMIYAAKIKNDAVWIKGAGKEFINSLEPFAE